MKKVHAFGSPKNLRQFNLASARVGFNGKENDNDVKGNGNQQDYGMRIYDPRLGRFLSVDPITSNYPFLSPYQFSNNNPIWAIDLDGLEAGLPKTEEGYTLKIKTLDVDAVNNMMKNLTAKVNQIYQTVELTDEMKSQNENYIKDQIIKRINWDKNGIPLVEEDKKPENPKSVVKELAKEGTKEVAKTKATSNLEEGLKNKFVKKAQLIQKIFKVADVVLQVADPMEFGGELVGVKLADKTLENTLSFAIDNAIKTTLTPPKKMASSYKPDINVMRSDALNVSTKDVKR